jgi:hypothetical protein
MFSVKSTCRKEGIWQRFTQKIREKPANAKIRENASPHFQRTPNCPVLFHSLGKGLGTVRDNIDIVSVKIIYIFGYCVFESQKSEVKNGIQ